MKLNKKYLALAVAGALLASGGAYAATQSVTANMAFQTVLTLTKTADVEFGTVAALTSGTYAVDTAGTLTASNGGVAVGGTPHAASITITGSASQTISVGTGGYAANNGATPSAARCSYNGGAEWACDTPQTGLTAPGGGAGHTLLVGVTVVTNGTQAAGTTAAPTFNVTVIYG